MPAAAPRYRHSTEVEGGTRAVLIGCYIKLQWEHPRQIEKRRRVLAIRYYVGSNETVNPAAASWQLTTTPHGLRILPPHVDQNRGQVRTGAVYTYRTSCVWVKSLGHDMIPLQSSTTEVGKCRLCTVC